MGTSRTSFPARAAMATVGCSALVVGMIVAAAGPASASPIACGYTATASVTLTANLDCTTATTDAIIIGVAGVTVDLNGYKILGPGADNGTEGIVDSPSDSAGASYDSVTIEDGTISNFSTDVDIEGTSGSPPTYVTGATVKDVTTTNNTLDAGEGVLGDYLDGAYIHHLTINDAETGVVLEYSESSRVNYSHLNSPIYGLYDDQGTENIWAHNVLSNVSYDGIELNATASATVKGNTVTGPDADGIDDDASSDLTIYNNVLNDLYDGAYQEDTSGGTVSDNKGTGDAYGLYGDDTTDITYTDNKFDSGQYGIETNFPAGEVLTGNITSDNSEDGVYVFTDGETSGSFSATLNNNTANDNRFGLDSQIVTTGSDNHATGNTVSNCYQVSC